MALRHDTIGDAAGATRRIAALLVESPVLLLLLYFSLHALLRWALGAPANLDEAEQFALADRFAAGYGPHPPLYQWLQTAAFGVFGVNFLAIALVKNALLAGAWIAIWRLGVETTGNRRLAAVGAFGLLFCPNLSWESQIDHTHTVSNTFLVALTALILFRLLRHRTPAGYAALGLAIGFGVMAKYNFLLFLAAAFAAFATHPAGRPVVLSRGFLLALAVGLAVCSPHLWYLVANPAEGTAKIGNLGLGRHGPVMARLAGLWELARAAIGVHALWLAVLALGWLDHRRDPRPPEPGLPQGRREAAGLLVRLWVFAALGFVLIVAVGGATSFRDHWLQPESIFFPLALAILFARRIDETAFRRLAVAAFALMLLIPLAVVANKRLFPGAQRDAAMPDPAALAAAFPRVADGSLPVVIGQTQARGFYAAGHLRYRLQIPAPAPAWRARAGERLRLFQAESAAAAGDGAVAIPFVRPEDRQSRQSQPWFAILER